MTLARQDFTRCLPSDDARFCFTIHHVFERVTPIVKREKTWGIVEQKIASDAGDDLVNYCQQVCLGGNREGGIPDPIPNSEVKPFLADGTILKSMEE